MSLHSLRFALNGELVEVTVPAERLLVELLRDDLSLTGTKLGCGVGVCGACTVLVDGRPMSACLLTAPRSARSRVWPATMARSPRSRRRSSGTAASSAASARPAS
jgi:aerobic-type carbon monoxide dehydrogenase small subunit (CoxS/CutS family)